MKGVSCMVVQYLKKSRVNMERLLLVIYISRKVDLTTKNDCSYSKLGRLAKC